MEFSSATEINKCDINNVDDTVNRELVGVDNWLMANRLSLNISKTSYMIISSQKNAIYIRIRDSILTNVSTVKFLGVTLDKILTFNDHVKNIITKIKSVGVMRLHCQLPADVMVKLYYSLVYSHLTYSLLAWGRLGRTNVAKVECAHRRARTLLTDYNHRILTFHSIYDYYALLKAFNTNTLKLFHQCFKDKLSSHQPSHMYSTRHRTNSNFNTPLFNHSKTKKCYLYQLIPLWNSLPSSLKNCTSKFTFKKHKSNRLAFQS